MFNVFEFIDSKDIREYHEKKHTRFSYDEMAVLVNESRFKNIHDKRKALKELIPYLSDDYNKSTISTSVQYLDHSFKKTVANTIDLYKKLLNCLNIAGIYTIKIYDNGNGTSYEYDNIFTEYKHAIGFLTKCFAEINITNPDYVYAYVFRRPSKYMNFDRITAYYMVDANLNIFDVSMQGVYYPTLNDYCVWIDLPFKSGDIVENIYGKEKYIYDSWEPYTFNGMLLYNKDMNLQLYNGADDDTEIVDDEVNPLALKLKEDQTMTLYNMDDIFINISDEIDIMNTIENVPGKFKYTLKPSYSFKSIILNRSIRLGDSYDYFIIDYKHKTFSIMLERNNYTDEYVTNFDLLDHVSITLEIEKGNVYINITPMEKTNCKGE